MGSQIYIQAKLIHEDVSRNVKYRYCFLPSVCYETCEKLCFNLSWHMNDRNTKLKKIKKRNTQKRWMIFEKEAQRGHDDILLSLPRQGLDL